MADIVSLLIAYENGELEDFQILELFSLLIKSGLAWELQGSYGRAARQAIDKGYLDEQGKILIGGKDG